MPNRNTPLSLAKGRSQWEEVDGTVSECVLTVCGDDCNKADALMLLVDLMTNEHYEPADRENVIAEVKQQAFKYMRGYDALLRDAVEKISPAPRKLSKAS